MVNYIHILVTRSILLFSCELQEIGKKWTEIPPPPLGSTNGAVPNIGERHGIIIDLTGLTSWLPIKSRRMDLSFFYYKATRDKCDEVGKKRAETVSNLLKTVAK